LVAIIIAHLVTIIDNQIIFIWLFENYVIPINFV